MKDLIVQVKIFLSIDGQAMDHLMDESHNKSIWQLEV